MKVKNSIALDLQRQTRQIFFPQGEYRNLSLPIPVITRHHTHKLSMSNPRITVPKQTLSTCCLKELKRTFDKGNVKKNSLSCKVLLMSSLPGYSHGIEV